MSTFDTLWGLQSDGYNIYVPNVEDVGQAKHCFKVIHKAIYDSMIPITKVIGFRIYHGQAHEDLLKSMHTYSQEALPEVMAAMSKIIIKDWGDMVAPEIKSASEYKLPLQLKLPSKKSSNLFSYAQDLFKVEVQLDPESTCKFPGSDGGVYKFLNQHLKLFTSLKSSAILELIVHRSSGYMTMERASSIPFPDAGVGGNLGMITSMNLDGICYLNTDFSLMDFVRVTPLMPMDHYDKNTKILSVPLKFKGGFTADDFVVLWQRMFNETNSYSYEWLLKQTKGRGGND